MAKIDKFRGKSKEELAGLGLEESLPLLTSRARRSVIRTARANHRYKQLIKKVIELKKAKSTKPIRTHVRNAIILPSWIGLTFAVHNGKEFKPVEITVDRIGFTLGDFAHTTGRVAHSGPGVGATRGSKFIPLK